MSGISSGIGLISGIDTAKLINQLIALDSRPVQTLQARVQQLDTRRAALMEMSGRLLAIRNAVTNFHKTSFFSRFSATSSNESALRVTAGENAIPGATTLRVHSLVSSHALISRGFADINNTPIGAGTITLESAQGRVNADTSLDKLHGGAGVRRGSITIVDRSGANATIDLTRALTVNDVLEAINGHAAINVRASVTGVASNGATGDRIVIEDISGGTGRLIISDVAGGRMAADLGIATDTTSERVDGAGLVRLNGQTPLSLLNDGNGVGRLRLGRDLTFTTSFGEFHVSLSGVLADNVNTDVRTFNSGQGVRFGVVRLTDRLGQSVNVDLTDLENTAGVTAQTIRERLTQEAAAAGVAISVSIVNSSFLVTDTSGATGDAAKELTIEDVSGFAAADLGIAGTAPREAIMGRTVYRIETVGDVIRAINFAPGNGSQVQAAISTDGQGLRFEALGFNNTVAVTAGQNANGSSSTAAHDLGLLDATFSADAAFESRPLMAGLNTVLLHNLRGGRGIGTGEVSFTDTQGRSTNIDFSSARTLHDIIDLINADTTTSLRARVNQAGNGVALYDVSGINGSITVGDVTGTTAADLGLAGSFDSAAAESINGGNLQRQYITRNTLLSSLNGGRGVGNGVMRITGTTGAIYSVNLDGSQTTMGQVIDAINRATPETIRARINDSGDGIVVEDTAGGDETFVIEDHEGGRAARDLRLAGRAAAGESSIDGSFETRITLSATDTLQDLIRKINNTDANVSASILRDGGSVKPFSLTLTSEISGRKGEMLIDATGVDLGLSTLSAARDAVVTLGDPNTSTPLLITSATNELKDVLPGVTFSLLSVSEDPVNVSVAQDMDGIVESVRTFVEAYNGLMDSLRSATRFDSETLERGPLFGETTVDTVRSRMQRVIMQRFDGVDESVSRLFSVGLRLGQGNRLTFNEEEFRAAYEQNPQQVESLFTREESGFGAVIQEALDDLTRSFDGVIARRDDLLKEQQDLINSRIANLNRTLDARRARLERQFAGLESALAGLQGQQSALSALTLLATNQ